MLRRRMLQAGVAIGLVAASLLGLSSAANASPTSFIAKAVHANGAGKLAVEATGGFIWYNRSVGLTSVKFYANAGECGYLQAFGWQGSAQIDNARFPGTGLYCGGTTGKWFTIGDFTLDGSGVYGGITSVTVVVVDYYHQISGYADCLKVASTCSTGQ
jgi:hypothetical protein